MIFEKFNYKILSTTFIRYSNIYINRQYNDDDKKNEKIFINDKIYIRRIYNLKFKIFRFIFQMHFTREKLKIKYFDREYIKDFFFCILLLYFLFIDNFDIYRNIYKVFKVFYFILTNLNYKKRRKFANIFTLILKLYNIIFKYVMKVFFKSIKKLNRDLNFEINDEIKKIYIYTITLIDDIFQQIENKNFAYYSAQKSY